METQMNISADSSWLSDLEMVDEDCNLNLNLNLLEGNDEEEFLSHDIASVFAFEEQRENLQQCLNTECISTTLSETFTEETSFESLDNFDFDFEKPNKQMKILDQSENDNITDNFSLKSATSQSSYQLPQILSFENPNPAEFYGYDQNQKETVTSESLGNRNFPSQKSKGYSKASRDRRSPAHKKDHIMAERKRREMLSQSFIALAALIPDLKKMDKASILAETIKYVKELQERLKILEQKEKNPKADQSTVTPIKPKVNNDEHYSSTDESTETESAADGSPTESLFKVEAKVSEQHMLIRIHCQKHNGLLVKIISKIQSFELFVVNNSVLAFGDSILDITIIAEIGEGYNLTVKELVHNIRMAALKFMST
ncbi:transcription factor NAI1-like [Vicia villosa]|uniref:transcription factor NAI1-like n=1 Tax=Vicia villosa TaxID=3911 RepID=UPI00273B4B53|nr:transcription factor NAI1-like [Vicia villosa]